MRPVRLIALPFLIAAPILLGVANSTALPGDAEFVARIAENDPSLAAGSLDATLDVLAVFNPGDRHAIDTWRTSVHPSPAGRRKTTLFVGLGTTIPPRTRARVAALGGTIVQTAQAGEAVNAELARDGSSLRIPSSHLAVLNDLTFSGLWGRPIPLERGPQRLFHGRRKSVRAAFLHGREFAVADSSPGWQRLVIPLSDGAAEFVWSNRSGNVEVPSLLGRPFPWNRSKIYDVVIPRVHRHGAVSLKKALLAQGLGGLFSSKAGSGGARLTDLVQSTDLAFDEWGIHLHADTVGFTALGVLHEQVRKIVIDRSFWLRISDARHRVVYVARVDDL
ncbi:MAG: serpin family protein [Candidatus Eremiobacteraeota bacterium]|nr:serpin family protein [Candidatus Eremiobacteraeota bacterium]